MSNQDHEATAKALLPCNCDAGNVPIWAPHQDYCISQYWPAVAAALAEQAHHYQTIIGDSEIWRAKDRNENAQLRAELAEAERDAALKERDDWKIAHALEDEMGSRLVEQRDAAFVRGLTRAKEIAESDDCAGWGRNVADAIAAEIDKAGKP